MEIPKVFHQIWLGEKALPGKFREWAELWVSMNPGWRMEWWTDSRLPEMRCRREFEGAEKMAEKSDILRYEVLAQFGGVYVDSDMEPLRPIGELLGGGVSAFYGEERPGEPCNAVLGCVAGDGFFRRAVEMLPGSVGGPGDIVDRTGPRFFKRVMGEYLGSEVERTVEGRRWRLSAKGDSAKRLWGFDWRVFYPYYYTEPEREWDGFPDATAKHHWTASWWKDGGV